MYVPYWEYYIQTDWLSNTQVPWAAYNAAFGNYSFMPYYDPWQYPADRGSYFPRPYPVDRGSYFPRPYPVDRGSYFPRPYPVDRGSYFPRQYPVNRGFYYQHPQRKGPVNRPFTDERKKHANRQSQEEKQPQRFTDLYGSRDPGEFTAKELTKEDLAVLESLYGNDIEDIYDLSGGQKWMLDRGGSVASAFFLQVILKAAINIDPPAFRKKADIVCSNRDSLRSAFVTEDTSRPYRVVLRNRKMEILFKDISHVGEARQRKDLKEAEDADRRRGFDLAKDSLIRISCYKIAEPDIYQIIVSQPHIDSDGVSLTLLLKDLFIDYAIEGTGVLPLKNETFSDRNYEQWLKERDIKGELLYWKEKLSGLTPHKDLPGRENTGLSFENHSVSLSLGEEMSEKLKGLQGKCRATVSVIMQAAWAVMMTHILEDKEIVYGLVTAGRDAEMSDSMQLTGGFINILPIRVQALPGMAFKDIVQALQTDQAEAMKNSHCSPNEICEAIGREGPLFDHLLNFHEFDSFARPMPKNMNAPFEIMDIRSYDNLSEDLCIYFVKNAGSIVCNFSFNLHAVTRETVQLLSEGYRQVLSQIIEAGGEIIAGDIQGPDMKSFERLKILRSAGLLKAVGKMREIKAFQSIEDRELWEILRESEIRTYQKNDTILAPGNQNARIYFVLSGAAEYDGVNIRGWTVPLKKVTEGCILDIRGVSDALSGRGRMQRSAVSTADGVQILSLPIEAFSRHISDHPEVALGVIKELLEEKAKAELLWMTV